MNCRIHPEKGWGLVLDVWSSGDPAEIKLLSEFVQQPGRTIFQTEHWNDPLVGPGCCFLAIAVLAPAPPWYRRILDWFRERQDNPRCFCPDCGADLGVFYSNRIRMVGGDPNRAKFRSHCDGP